MGKWLREQWEWFVMCFLVWFLDVFDQRKEGRRMTDEEKEQEPKE